MDKKYNELAEVMVAGSELISEHLEWLITMALLETCDTEAVNLIVFNEKLPDDMWGVYHGDVRAIAINLEQHFEFARSAVMDEATNTNIRLVLLHDLIDTVMHEAWHARKCAEGMDYRESDLDEEGAKKWSEENSWSIGKDFDPIINDLGPFLEEQLLKFHSELREDCKEESVPKWKTIQLKMLESNIAYLNEEKDIIIKSFREAMQVASAAKEEWPAEYKSINEPKEEEKVMATPEKEEKVVAISEKMEEPTHALDGYNPLDDIGLDTENPFENEQAFEQPEQTAMAAPAVLPTMPQVTIPVQQTVKTETVVANQQDANQMLRIAELVMRRLFHHVYTKCSATTDGRFAYPGAVLEPVNILDIAGVKELITYYDRTNTTGQYESRQVNDGQISGLVSKQGLPYYRFYINIGGVEYRRTFIPQNPDKVKSNGSLTTWATKVRTGEKIMMLLGDNGPTAHIESGAGIALGQETFKVWQNK